MGKRSSKRSLPLFRKSRSAKRSDLRSILPSPPAPSTKPLEFPREPKGSKKKGNRLWMRFDRTGSSEIVELEKGAIISRASVPARDLRILGPIFSHSANILARDKAMIVNLEFIKAIVTAEEVLVLDPLCQEVLPFVDQLRQKIHLKGPFRIHETGHTEVQSKEVPSPSTGGQWLNANESAEGERELPFEFQVLEIALETVCSYLESRVTELVGVAYPLVDELAISVSTKNLDRVRNLKTDLTRFLARVQKVRDEIEHLLDDDEDMAHLYLTRKQIQYQHLESLIASGSTVPVAQNLSLSRLGSNRHGSIVTSTIYSDDNEVEDLEMLLESYFMQLDATHNKILSVREYIDDTEDYVNIQLDNQRNELIQLQLILGISMFAISIDTLIVGILAMNTPCSLYEINGIFWPFVWGTSAGCFLIMLLLLGYARWKKLIGG